MIETLKMAISKIDEKKYSITNPANYSQSKVEPEHNFVSELYHQLRMIIPNTKGLELATDLYKIINESKNVSMRYQESMRKIIGRGNGIKPDLVYHYSQEDRDPSNQILALECKIDSQLSQERFNYDLFKLMVYKHQFNFQIVTFLIVNNPISKIAKFLSNYESEYYINKESLSLLVIERYGSSPRCLIENPESIGDLGK